MGARKRLPSTRKLSASLARAPENQVGSRAAFATHVKERGLRRTPCFTKKANVIHARVTATSLFSPASKYIAIYTIYRPCNGSGLVEERIEKTIKFPRFTEHDATMQFEHEGNQSNYVKKGEDGHLIIRFNVETDNT